MADPVTVSALGVLCWKGLDLAWELVKGAGGNMVYDQAKQAVGLKDKWRNHHVPDAFAVAWRQAVKATRDEYFQQFPNHLGGSMEEAIREGTNALSRPDFIDGWLKQTATAGGFDLAGNLAANWDDQHPERAKALTNAFRQHMPPMSPTLRNIPDSFFQFWEGAFLHKLMYFFVEAAVKDDPKAWAQIQFSISRSHSTFLARIEEDSSATRSIVGKLGQTVLQGNSESLQRDKEILALLCKVEARFLPIGIDASQRLASDAEMVLLNAAKPYADAVTVARIAIVQGDSASATRLVPLAVQALKGFTDAVVFEQSRLLGDAAFLARRYDTAIEQYRVARDLRSDDQSTAWRMFVALMNRIEISHHEYEDRVYSATKDSDDEESGYDDDESGINERKTDFAFLPDDLTDDAYDARDALESWIDSFSEEQNRQETLEAPARAHSAINSLERLADECRFARFSRLDAANFVASSNYEREYKAVLESQARRDSLRVMGIDWTESAYWLLQALFGDEEDIVARLFFTFTMFSKDTQGHRLIAASAADAVERCGLIGAGWKAALRSAANRKQWGDSPNREVQEIYEKSGCAELLSSSRD